MGPRFQQAYVEDVDDFGNVILGSKKSASRVIKKPAKPRKTTRIKRNPPMVVGCSVNRGPIETAVKEFVGVSPMTIMSDFEDNGNERNGTKCPRFRKLLCKGSVVTKQHSIHTETFIKRKLFLSENDRNKDSLVIFMEQKCFYHGQEATIVKELKFPGKLKTDTTYVFKNCGDELPSVGQPDLRITLHMLSDDEWTRYTKQARYYGYDTNIDVCLIQEDIRAKRFYYSFEQGNMGITHQKPEKGICIKSDQLQNLFFATLSRKASLSAFGPDPRNIGLSKDGAVPKLDGEGEAVEVFSQTLIGYGERSEDGLHIGDLNLRIYVRI